MDYDYTEENIKKLFTEFVDGVGLPKVALVVQGFIYSQYALMWALENPSRVDRIVILNAPLKAGTEMPFVLKQYTLPIVSNFVAQDAMRAERFLEGGSAYSMAVEDADRYREPFLESMMPGLALVDLMSKCKYEQLLQKVEAAVKTSSLKVRVAWGMDDPYLAAIDAQAFCEATSAEFVAVQGKAGHIVAMDYPESVSQVLSFLALLVPRCKC
jgi:pimeloyl-ACP methyl ester carboxylesterase